MDFVRCDNGHFYDRDANPGGCPFCVQLRPEKDAEPAPAPGLEMEPEPEPEPASSAEPRSFSPAQTTLDEHLTVGWLVSVAGSARGRSFALVPGRNFIGRHPDMDVSLSDDPSVAERRQASVVFDPRTERFSVTANETRELTYVNDELVYDHRDLVERDVVSVGSTKLMLVPLCGPDFAWQDWPD